jgi:Spy/CpxP family protein refolding chaperone
MGGPNGGPGGPPPAGAPGGSPDDVLKEVLGLSDAQITQLHTLLDARRTANETLRTQIEAAQKALKDALDAATPDPTAVGNALLAVRNLEKQIQAANDAFRTSFEALLTADQKAKLEAIETLQKSLRAADALHRLGVYCPARPGLSWNEGPRACAALSFQRTPSTRPIRSRSDLVP